MIMIEIYRNRKVMKGLGAAVSEMSEEEKVLYALPFFDNIRYLYDIIIF